MLTIRTRFKSRFLQATSRKPIISMVSSRMLSLLEATDSMMGWLKKSMPHMLLNRAGRAT